MNKLLQAHILFHFLRMLPRKFPVKDSSVRQPFFVLGSGRNGSTMLNRMLNQHSKFFLPSEQYFLGPSIFKFHYYNFAIWRDLVKIIAGELIPSGGSHTWSVRDLPDFLKLYTLPKQHKNLQFLLDSLFRFYGKQSGDFETWGDTTPLNTYYLPEVYNTFPKAKYLFLVRDGRDVVASYKKGGAELLGDLSNPENAANHWMHSLSKYKYLRSKTEVKLIRYEELVSDPKKVLSAVCEYLGVEFEEQMLGFNEHIPNAEMYHLPVHENLKKPVFQSSVGNYKDGLTNSELAAVMKIIDKGLHKFNYV